MARTFKGLYPRIYDFDNLWLTWRRARRGGKRQWPTVAAIARTAEPLSELKNTEDPRGVRSRPSVVSVTFIFSVVPGRSNR